jgi:hypothetical protein
MCYLVLVRRFYYENNHCVVYEKILLTKILCVVHFSKKNHTIL